ncbi:MAG TPA: hypothetical protein VIF02_14620 [Methylocella sp.]|jgi:hypothetical protein
MDSYGDNDIDGNTTNGSPTAGSPRIDELSVPEEWLRRAAGGRAACCQDSGLLVAIIENWHKPCVAVGNAAPNLAFADFKTFFGH